MTVLLLICCLQVIGLITKQNFRYHPYRSISGQIQQLKCAKQSSTENIAVSVVFASFNYAEIPYDASIFRWCRLRGSYGGPWDNYDFSRLF